MIENKILNKANQVNKDMLIEINGRIRNGMSVASIKLGELIIKQMNKET